MAGIGFELQRLLKKESIGSFFKVALAGIIIVAGPWLVAILGIFLIDRIAHFALPEHQSLFMSVIIYTYAVSLFLFGGLHYVFTRFLSDLIYLEKNREAGSALVFICVVIALLASAIAIPALWGINLPNLSHPILFKAAALCFFIAVNVLWILMIFISLSKRYMVILLTFLTGMACSVMGLRVLGRIYGLGGAMLGFSLGQLLTVALLGALALWEYRPARFLATVKEFFLNIPRHGYLLLAGLFYYWGIWIDKLVFWFFLGSPIEGTPFKLFQVYDMPVYLSNLAMIPGLIYFVVICETDFYVRLKEFLQSLSSDVFIRIQEKKYALIRQIKEGLFEQSVFQGILTLVLFLLVPVLTNRVFQGSISTLIMRTTLVAVLLHFIFLTLMTFLFYLELYREASLASFTFFSVNLMGSLVTARYGISSFCGLSYLAGGLAASVVAYLILLAQVRNIDRRIYSQYGLR